MDTEWASTLLMAYKITICKASSLLISVKMGLKWSPLISEYFWMGTPPDHQEMDWRPPPS